MYLTLTTRAEVKLTYFIILAYLIQRPVGRQKLHWLIEQGNFNVKNYKLGKGG